MARNRTLQYSTVQYSVVLVEDGATRACRSPQQRVGDMNAMTNQIV